VFLLYSLHVGIRAVFYLAVIPGLLAFCMVLLVTERPVAVPAQSKINVSPRQLPKDYWKYLLATALFWTRQREQRVSDPPNAGYRCASGNDDPDLRGI
jgi:hypothetical protein